MKKYLFLIAQMLLVGSCKPAKTPVEQIKAAYLRDLKTLIHSVENDLMPLAARTNSQDSLQKVFLKCRLSYKKIEHFTEYFYPTTSRLVNGPPLPEYELEENKSFEAGGLQVIEEVIYPFDITNREVLVREIAKILPELRRYQQLWEATEFTDAHVFDAARLQLFRIISLGISGFDTPLCQNALPETKESLEAVAELLKVYEPQNQAEWQSLQVLFENAAQYAAKNTDFNAFDRAEFITQHINPLSRRVLAFQKMKGIQPFNELRALRGDAATLFDKDVFNADFYASTADDARTKAKIALGHKLFYAPVLSSNKTRTCATCHQPDRAFTDGLTTSANLKKGFIGRNAPTLLYAALQKGQFYDQRAPNLEGQTQDVIQNKDEMHGSLTESSTRLQKSEEWVTAFREAFPNLKEIKPYHIMNALASYERTLTPFNSRFDRYMRGEKQQMNNAEIRGFNLFMGKAKCGICHFMPLFNGTVPPQFTKSESEVIGVMTAPLSKKIDPDVGKGLNYPTLPGLKYAFKTTTVRNAALTAPYMHNGAYKTLDEVIEFYDHGGAAGLAIDLPNQTLPFDKLNLSMQEKSDIISFIKTLTDQPDNTPKLIQSLGQRSKNLTKI